MVLVILMGLIANVHPDFMDLNVMKNVLVAVLLLVMVTDYVLVLVPVSAHPAGMVIYVTKNVQEAL